MKKVSADVLLDIKNLSIEYKTKRGNLHAVKDATISINGGESVAFIGESGCGKTTLASSIVGALPNAARVSQGELLYNKGDNSTLDLLKLSKKQLRPILWQDISMVFQASQSSFNPVKKIKTQFIDAVKAHEKNTSVKEILERSSELLKTVMLDADKVLNAFPHELSGGMKQRTLIALSLILNPRLIILDEPTTALDLITQEKILELLNNLKKKYKFSLIFITHDLGIVSELADTVATMYAGKIVEKAPAKRFFEQPLHPYSKGLIDAIPRLSMDNNSVYSIPGTPPDMVDEKKGCAFAPRCNRRVPKCDELEPTLTECNENERFCACFNPVIGGDGNG